MRNSIHRTLSAAGCAALLAAASVAGGAGSDLTVIFVTDPDLDSVFILQDLAQDGDFNDPGDTQVFYDGLTGPFLLSNPVAIATDPFDQVFVGDSDTDRIYVLRDNDDSGSANGPGESAIYFDGNPGGNASGVLIPQVTALALRILGTLWVTNANANGSEADTVIRLRDLNGDGDANDLGEARVYYTSGPSLPLDASILTSIDIGYDGLVYVLESGTARPRSLLRLIDFDGSGVIDTTAEVQTAWEPLQSSPGDFTSAEIGAAGEWYVLDRANGLVQIGFDVNSDGLIDANTEAAPFWALPQAGGLRDMAVAVDGGEVYVGDTSGSPDLIVRAKDFDATGSIDIATEVNAVYDDTVSATNIDNPHSIATDFHDHEEVGEAFCTGDSPLCPCNNLGNSGSGCANSIGVGASLEGTGTDGIANDDLVLEASQLRPNVPALLFAGTSVVNGGLGAVFGDGLRCVTGSLVRLGIQFADPVGFAEWGPGHVGALGVQAGDTRYFQVWYRNNAGPCGLGFNLTNGVQVTFTQ